jgi:superfamily II RNA helicase
MPHSIRTVKIILLTADIVNTYEFRDRN